MPFFPQGALEPIVDLLTFEKQSNSDEIEVNKKTIYEQKLMKNNKALEKINTIINFDTKESWDLISQQFKNATLSMNKIFLLFCFKNVDVIHKKSLSFFKTMALIQILRIIAFQSQN